MKERRGHGQEGACVGPRTNKPQGCFHLARLDPLRDGRL
jgi:hypothetical protein